MGTYHLITVKDEHESITNRLKYDNDKNYRFKQLKQIIGDQTIKAFDNFDDVKQEIIKNSGVLIVKSYTNTLKIVGYSCKVAVMEDLFSFKSAHLVFKVSFYEVLKT